METNIVKDSTILRVVRDQIAEGRHTYICVALSDACSVPGTQEQRMRLVDWVEHMLGLHHTYYLWLTEEFPLTALREDAGRLGRVAWLTWMIEQCETAERNAAAT